MRGTIEFAEPLSRYKWARFNCAIQLTRAGILFRSGRWREARKVQKENWTGVDKPRKLKNGTASQK